MEKIRECPYCHQKIVITNPWKALWRKPTMGEWITLFIMAMMAFGAWAYNRDIQVCRDYMEKVSYNPFLMNAGTPDGNPPYSPYPIKPNETIDFNITNDSGDSATNP